MCNEGHQGSFHYQNKTVEFVHHGEKVHGRIGMKGIAQEKTEVGTSQDSSERTR